MIMLKHDHSNRYCFISYLNPYKISSKGLIFYKISFSLGRFIYFWAVFLPSINYLNIRSNYLRSADNTGKKIIPM